MPLEEEVNIFYKDYNGSTSQTAMFLNQSSLSGLENKVYSDLEYSLKDLKKYSKISNKNNKGSYINLDHSKVIDLLYMSYKFNHNLHSSDDHDKIILLAKSINLC